MAGAISDLVRTLGVGQLVLGEGWCVIAGGKQWAVQVTPGTCHSWLWGPPSSVSSCGKGSGGPYIANLTKKMKPNFEKKEKSQLVQNGSWKPGNKSGVRKPGKGSGAVWLCIS